MHYSLGFLKVTLGLLRLSAVRMGGVINLSAESLSTPWTPTPRVLCMRAGLWEWVHPVPSRQGIYLLNSQSLSVVGGHRYNILGLGLPPTPPHPSLSPALCPIFQPRLLACATSSQGFGPLTGKLWGIRRVRTEKMKEKEEQVRVVPSKGQPGAASLRIVQRWA